MTNDDREFLRLFAQDAAGMTVPKRDRQRGRSATAALRPLLAGVVVIVMALVLGRALADFRDAGSVAGTPAGTAIPAGPFIVGTETGGVYELGPSGLGQKIFDCQERSVQRLERSPDGSRLFILCRDANDSGDVYGEGFVWQPGSGASVIPLVLVPDASTWSPDGRELLLLTYGSGCPLSQPDWVRTQRSTPTLCLSRMVAYDVAVGTDRVIGDELVAPENLRWTSEGPSYFFAGPQGGTFAWQEGQWHRLSRDRIAAVAPDGRFLLEREARTGSATSYALVLRDAQGETVLTPAGATERGLAFDPSGNVVAQRTGSGVTSLVVYEDAKESSASLGAFGASAVAWDGWLASLVGPTNVVFFSTEDRRFASAPLIVPETVTAIGLRPQ